MRVGLGFDVHAFTIDRPLMLGGVKIDYDKGLAGHSDADVLTHAIMDAMLGALALGDIGEHFPDTSARYHNISSIQLLKEVNKLIKAKHYQLGNLDCIIMAEQPKISPYKEEIRKKLADALEIDISYLSVKATTTEKLGFVGREEGIAAQAVVQLVPIQDASFEK